MSLRRAKNATYADVDASPPGMNAELVDGELVLSPRPALPHANAASVLGSLLTGPFRFGRAGPGGWVILDEPELRIRGDALVPDLAGWRRERLPEVPDLPNLDLAPDWACEVLSPSTAGFDRGKKLRVYGEWGVRHMWLIDPLAKTLEVLRLDEEGWRLVTTSTGDELIRVEPFDAIELELGLLWSR